MKNNWKEMNTKTKNENENEKNPSFNTKGIGISEEDTKQENTSVSEEEVKQEDTNVSEKEVKQEDVNVSQKGVKKADMNVSQKTKSPETKNSIYIVGGEKGGVGKSFLTRCMLDFFISQGWNEEFILIEADPTINDVSSIYNEGFGEVTFSDNKFSHDEPDLILESAENKSVVVNLPSNVCIQFDSWVERSQLLSKDVKEHFNHLVYFFVSDGCFRSIDRFIKQIEHYGNKELTHCLVLNPGRLTCAANFSYLNEYKPLLEILKKHKVPVLQVPELSAQLQFECDRDSISYRELANKQKFTARAKIKGFLQDVDSLFGCVFTESINEPLGLEKIIKKQMKEYRAGKLPFETMAELFAS